MTPRDRTLAVVLVGLIVLAGVGFVGYMFVYEPIQAMNATAAKLGGEINDLQGKVRQIQKDAPRLADARKRSLPADPNLASNEYNEMMSHLVRQAGIAPGYSVVSKSAPDTRSIPLLPGPAAVAGQPAPPKKPAYTKVVTEVDFKKADMWAVHDFLQNYYRLNLLQQITVISIKRDDENQPGSKAKASPDRKDLNVKITTEAIIIDGAENRRTLLPVSNAFAAVGGWPGYDLIALSPEMGRGLTPLQFTPILATKKRDYTFIVQKDMFHGPLPPPPGLGIGEIGDVAVKLGEPIPPIKIPVKGEPTFTGAVKLDVKVDSKLFSAGSIKIDQKNQTVTAIPAKDQSGSATFEVIATAANGQVEKRSFVVKIAEAETTGKGAAMDIAPAVILIAVTSRSDGTAQAVIRDNANKQKYEIEATAKGVKVAKFFYFKNQKKEDINYRLETSPLLAISDDVGDADKEKPVPIRTFKIIALTDDGLILQDVGPKPAARFDPKPPKPTAVPLNGPLAAVVGVPGALIAPQPAALLRWAPGKSLAALTPVPADEAQKIWKRVASSGPVGGAVVEAVLAAPMGN